MRPRPALPATVAACLVLAAAVSAAPGSDLEPLYRWGEYDSLIRAAGPRLDADSVVALPAAATRSDTLEQARDNLYLGVAYWAQGREAAGLRAFARAVRLDPLLRPDPLYATAEMSARYEALAAEEADRRRPAKLAGRRGPPWWLLSGAVLVSGAAVGAYYIASSPRKRPDTVVVIAPKQAMQ